jgi:hypothetical protein
MATHRKGGHEREAGRPRREAPGGVAELVLGDDGVDVVHVQLRIVVVRGHRPGPVDISGVRHAFVFDVMYVLRTMTSTII